MSLPSLKPASSPLRYISRTFSDEQAHLLASVSGEYGRSAIAPPLGELRDAVRPGGQDGGGGHAGVSGRMPTAPGSISLRSTEPLCVSSAVAVTIPFAGAFWGSPVSVRM